jgi:hypothetical protein
MKQILWYSLAIAAVSSSLSATGAGATAPCTLSDSDVQALALSPSHVTAAGFLTLAPEAQKWVCNTRAAIRQLDLQNGVVTDATLKITMAYSTKYMSPAENDRMVDASNVWFAKLLKSKGLSN